MPSPLDPGNPLHWPPDMFVVPAGTPSFVRVVMVGSVDGAATRQGRSGGLSGEADRRLMRLLRATSDAVLVGAGTARTENYGPPRLPADLTTWRLARGMGVGPRLVMVTGRLSLDPAARMFEAWDGPRPLVVTTRPQSEVPPELAAVAEVATVPTTSPTDVLDAVHRRGMRSVVCEGGPSWLADMLGADAVDELWLTVSPVVLGGDASRIVHGPQLPGGLPLRLQRLAHEGDFVFLTYRRER